VELIEIAPGIDLERDILARMKFKPIVRGQPKRMDARIFQDQPMHLRRQLLAIPLEQRLSYEPRSNTLFINFEGLAISTLAEVADIRERLERLLAPLDRRVLAIVNYDNFSIAPGVLDAYSDLVQDLMQRYYSGVTRYTTSSFLRAKLGDALEQRGVAPYIHESAQEAEAHLRELGDSAPA
jgi:propionate CoA-transferase